MYTQSQDPILLRNVRKFDNNIIRFLHASDIHLGCAQYTNEYRADDFIKAFQEILNLAIKLNVNFIILCGDVFTSIDILPEKLTKIVRILNNFQNLTSNRIPIISIEGNHDLRKFSRGMKVSRKQSWLRLLNELGLLILLSRNDSSFNNATFSLYNPETKRGNYLKLGNIEIYGTKYQGENPLKHLKRINSSIREYSDSFVILMQHFGIEGTLKGVPGVKFQRIQFLKEKIDYLALGHFHAQYVIDDWIFNPGSSEASCSIDATFKRGIFYVELKNIANKWTKKVSTIKLRNRKGIWKEIYIHKVFRDTNRLYEYVLLRLKTEFNHLKELNNHKKPILYLKLTGKKQLKSCKPKKQDLKEMILNEINILDIRIYFHLEELAQTIDKYLL